MFSETPFLIHVFHQLIEYNPLTNLRGHRKQGNGAVSSDFSQGRKSELFFRLLYFNFFVRFFVGAWIRHFINDSIATYTFPHYPVSFHYLLSFQKLTLFAVLYKNKIK